MSRIPALTESEADGKTKKLLDDIQKTIGMVPNLYRVAAQSPASLDGLVGLTDALNQGRLSPHQREQIAIAIAERTGSHYCVAAHTVLGRRAGVSEADLALARQGRATDPATEAALRFVLCVADLKGHVCDADLSAILKAGFGPGDVVEIVALVALGFFMATLNNVANTDLDFPPVQWAA